MNRVEVCFSPADFHLYEKGFECVVVIDVLRATSAICAALDSGVGRILPVATLEEARALQAQGHLAAAERNGQIVEGFDLGNSPIVFKERTWNGETVVLTTTNGTKSIALAAEKNTVVTGALNNVSVLSQWLIDQKQDVLILGSGWKDKFNLEDTVCGGAIVDMLLDSRKFQASEDSTIAAKFLYLSARENLWSFLKASSHRQRLRNLNLNADIKYCLTPDISDTIPVLRDGFLVKLRHDVDAVQAKKMLLA